MASFAFTPFFRRARVKIEDDFGRRAFDCKGLRSPAEGESRGRIRGVKAKDPTVNREKGQTIRNGSGSVKLLSNRGEAAWPTIIGVDVWN